MTLPTESNLDTYITTRWTVSPPGSIETGDFMFSNADNILVFKTRSNDPVPVSAGISRREQVIEFRLSHASKTSIDTLIGYLEDYVLLAESLWDTFTTTAAWTEEGTPVANGDLTLDANGDGVNRAIDNEAGYSLNVTISSTTKLIFEVTQAGGDYCFRIDTSAGYVRVNGVNVITFTDGVHDVEFKNIDWTNETFDVYLDDTLIAAANDFARSTPAKIRISRSTGDTVVAHYINRTIVSTRLQKAPIITTDYLGYSHGYFVWKGQIKFTEWS